MRLLDLGLCSNHLLHGLHLGGPFLLWKAARYNHSHLYLTAKAPLGRLFKNTVAQVPPLDYWMRIRSTTQESVLNKLPGFMWPGKFENGRWGCKNTDLWIEWPVFKSPLNLANSRVWWNPISLPGKRGYSSCSLRLVCGSGSLPTMAFSALCVSSAFFTLSV